ncbi:hypothetical protein CVV43_01940 [Candidatus Saccharibacteria bacterium HGW-Saccharibacteria-1]|jgi:uncharacterized membrane protein|nr:MAG: hypothetical protein CVV43_01940 [Candidatus Saccharibacteria bacterium HGW-Saccharibacteria-1]
MVKITEYEKKRLVSSFINLDIRGQIEYYWDDRLDIEQEMIDIYIKRVENGSSRYRAYIDTVDDILIKYRMPPNKIDKGYAARARNSTKKQYYSIWCTLIATIIAAQLFFLFGSIIADLPLFRLLTVQGVFLGFALIMFLYIFILISKDKNYNTDDELRAYCKYQIEVFMIIIFSPFLMFIELFRPSARKR